jgi:protein involved in polysaccharide export with SLBB domain
MEKTQGLGREAEVWVRGNLLTVCDAISTPGQKTAPGVLDDVKLAYMSAGGFTWSEAAAANRQRRRELDHQQSWSYTGYGRVIQIMPVLIDFGLCVMEDSTWTNDESLVDKFVAVPIQRLEIVPAHVPDWPK